MGFFLHSKRAYPRLKPLTSMCVCVCVCVCMYVCVTVSTLRPSHTHRTFGPETEKFMQALFQIHIWLTYLE